MLFGTTRAFLEQLGLDSLDELPALGDFVPGADVVEQLEHGLRPDARAAERLASTRGHGRRAPGPGDESDERSRPPATRQPDVRRRMTTT